MKITEIITEEWSQKYKNSINCSHPKGFSQKAHCAGKKKHDESIEMEAVCPDCGMCEAHGNSKIYDKCWTGFRKVPGKKRGEDGSCKKIGEDVEENFADGRNPQDKGDSKRHGVPTKASVSTLRKVAKQGGRKGQLAHWMANMKAGRAKNEDIEQQLSLEEQFDIVEEMIEYLAQQHNVNAEEIWEDVVDISDDELYESAAWHRKAGKNKNGGLNAKGVASYRREHPGSKLQTAVTTKPSKLKPGSKAAKRRKSFCARMSGVDGPMKKPNGEPTRKALALRKWNC